MSYNLVKKGESIVLVKKFRDIDQKVREQYITSLGVMTDAEFKDFRERCYEHPQDHRIEFCMRSGRVQETLTDTPRRKIATGDIREQPIKKEEKVKKEKKPKTPYKRTVPIWTERSWQKKGYLKIREKREKVEKAKPIERPVMTKAEIDNRIERIKADIKFSKSVIAQKKTVQTFTKTERESVQNTIDYHQSVVDTGTQAIEILKKQKSGMR